MPKNSKKPASLPDTGLSLLNAVTKVTGCERGEVWNLLNSSPNPRVPGNNPRTNAIKLNDLRLLAKKMGVSFKLDTGTGSTIIGRPGQGLSCYNLYFRHGRWSATQSDRDGQVQDESKQSQDELKNSQDESEKKASQQPTHPEVQQKLWSLCRSHSCNYIINASRADTALKAIEQKKMGVVLNKNTGFLSKARNVVNKYPDRVTQHSVTLSGILGEGGTGKSYPIIQILARRYQCCPEDDQWAVIAPTNKRQEKIVQDLKLKKELGHDSRVRTWERAFLRHLPPVVIFENCQFFPAFDLLLLCQPRVRYVFFTGEVGHYGVQVPPTVDGWQSCPPMVDLVKFAACDYLLRNWRLGTGVCEKMQITPMTPHPGDIEVITMSSPIQNMKSDATKVTLKSYTVVGSGTDSPLPAEIVVDNYVARAKDKAIYTMLFQAGGDLKILLPPNHQSLQFNSSILAALSKAATGDWEPFKIAVDKHRKSYIPKHLQDSRALPGKEPPSFEVLLN